MDIFTEIIKNIRSPIQHRRGTETALEASDYIPAPGEIVTATDTGVIKAGDGIHTWSELHANSNLEARIAAIERSLIQAGLLGDDYNIDEILDDIFSGNNSTEPENSNTPEDDNGLNNVLNSIFNN